MIGSLRERFDAKMVAIPIGGCWVWTAATNNKGYGQIFDGEKVQLAHRISYAMHVGPVANDIEVMHRCDNPACVNPHHLSLGTRGDNMADMAKKNRGNRKWKIRGNEVPFSKLSAEQVLEIRDKYAAKKGTQRQLAREYGVTQPAIGCIVRRDVWKHI